VDAAPVTSRFEQRVAVVVAGREVYREVKLDRLGVAVTEPAPFRLTLVPPPVAVAADGRLALTVRAERRPGFNGAIRLSLPFNPPYLERPNEEQEQIEIGEGETTAQYPLQAQPAAQVSTWEVAILGRAEVDGGAVWVATNTVPLAIKSPDVRLMIEATETEVGTTVPVVCQVTALPSFTGLARARLAGLPKDCSAPEMSFDQHCRRIVFPVTVGRQAPPGIHNALYCEVALALDEDVATQFVGRGGVLEVRSPGTPAREKRSRLTVLRAERAARQPAESSSNPSGEGRPGQ
jgi:hypothetical protein